MNSSLIENITSHSEIKYLIVNYKTLAHPKISSNYTARLWAKYMILYLGLPISIDDLYFTRQESVNYLIKEIKLSPNEISYKQLVCDIYNRLKNGNLQGLALSLDHFMQISESVELKVAKESYHLYDDTVSLLKILKDKDYKIICVANQFTTKNILQNLIQHQGLSEIISEIFIPSEHYFKEEFNNIYKFSLSTLDINLGNAAIISSAPEDLGSLKSEALLQFHIKHPNTFKTQSIFGNDKKDFKKIIKNIYKTCNKKSAPIYSDYVILLSVFTEKLYKECLKNGVKNLFFLAREGLFLKRLFDYYQEVNQIEYGPVINTHYLKISRQSSLQIGLKDLQQENFEYYRVRYKNTSIDNFLNNFSFSKTEVQNITNELDLTGSSHEFTINFFDSETFINLLKTESFKKAYESNRTNQKKAFNNYLEAFNVPYEDEGLYLVDIGWGGTIQDAIYDYLERKTPVNGYYLGLKEFRHELECKQLDVIKRGLNFEVYLYANYSATIMMSNIELYENLCQAPHGTTIGYQDTPGHYAIEAHKESEKIVYDTYLRDSQNYMFDIFKYYCQATKLICYDNAIINEVATQYALKISTIIPKRKIKHVINLSKGFYDNIGNHSAGEEIYQMNVLKGLVRKLGTIKNYIISPEQLVTYVLSTKITLYSKNKLLYIPAFPLYYYILLNRFVKKNVSKFVYSKYSLFR